MLVALWALLASLILVGAGYSHYRYRVKYNRYYAKLYSRSECDRATAALPRFSPYALPGVVLVILCILLPGLLVL